MSTAERKKPATHFGLNRFVHKLNMVLLSLFLLLIITLYTIVGLVLWHPKIAQYALPYLEQFTDGQLQIESAEGRLIDGLQLKNIQYQTPEFSLQINNVSWRWQLNALLINQLQVDQLHIEQAKLKLHSQTKADESALTTAPFEIITQLNQQFTTAIHINQLQIDESTLQIDAQPEIKVTQINSAVHWQDLNLRLQRFSAHYQAYQLQSTSNVTIQDPEKLEAHLGMKLLGVELAPQNNEIALTARIKGGAKQLEIELQTTQPVKSLSHHTLKIDATKVSVDSQWLALQAAYSKQWQIDNLTGHSALRYQLASTQISSQGKLQLAMANRPKVAFDYTLNYPALNQANAKQLQIKLHSQFEKMGTLQAQGSINLENTTGAIEVATQGLNFAWLDNTQNYQLDSQFRWQLTNFGKRQSTLDIEQFVLTGLPETLTAKGRLTGRLSSPTEYTIDVLSSQLNYAKHTGDIQAKLALKPDLSTIKVDNAKMTLGNNLLDLSGQWSEKFALTLNAKLNQLEQLYPAMAGKIDLNLSANGQVNNDFSGFKQAWSTIDLNASQLSYQFPKTDTQANFERYSLNSLTLQGKVPLHQPEWSLFTLNANTLHKHTGLQQKSLLFTELQFKRKPIGKTATAQNALTGLTNQLQLNHPDLNFNAIFTEKNPSFKQASINLQRLDISQPLSGDWALQQPASIQWQKPSRVSITPLCLLSAKDKQAKLCLDAKQQQANWTMQSLPVLSWLKPWMSPSLSATGLVNGDGQAQWHKTLNVTQNLYVPQLNLTMNEQGFEIPFLVKEWQTTLHFTPQQANLTSHGQINESGRLQANISSQKPPEQAWSNAKMDGQIKIELNDWQLNKRALQMVELHKTALQLESKLSGQLSALKHQTEADLQLQFNLPLLGLSNQVVALKANVNQDKIVANGLWKQPENRQADLQLTLTDIQQQPKILAHFKTRSIELLKTEFAHFNTS
ncbi:MAG: hypothetical protein R3254_03080, partial [Thiomicrorhabdus sp.]|nr:hypothetical protein [Thiomicrorhabdus sp.]